MRRIEEYTYLLNEIEDLQRSEKTRTAAAQAAMNLIWERRERPAQERDALVVSHKARLIVEPVSILFICWRALAFAVGVPAYNENAVRALLNLQKRSDVYHKAFADSQRAYYR